MTVPAFERRTKSLDSKAARPRSRVSHSRAGVWRSLCSRHSLACNSTAPRNLGCRRIAAVRATRSEDMQGNSRLHQDWLRGRCRASLSPPFRKIAKRHRAAGIAKLCRSATVRLAVRLLRPSSVVVETLRALWRFLWRPRRPSPDHQPKWIKRQEHKWERIGRHIVIAVDDRTQNTHDAK